MPRAVTTLVLLILFTACFLQPMAPAPARSEGITGEKVVKVFYFHRKFRCPECEKTEKLVKETLSNHFSEELEGGMITWQVVDLSIKGNQHYLTDYDFIYNTVMIVENRSGKDVRYKNLEKIFEFGENRKGAMGFIRGEVENFLGHR